MKWHAIPKVNWKLEGWAGTQVALSFPPNLWLRWYGWPVWAADALGHRMDHAADLRVGEAEGGPARTGKSVGPAAVWCQ